MKKSVYFLLFTKSRNSHRTVNKVTRSCRFWFVKQTFLPHNHFIQTVRTSARSWFQVNYRFIFQAQKIGRTFKSRTKFPAMADKISLVGWPNWIVKKFRRKEKGTLSEDQPDCYPANRVSFNLPRGKIEATLLAGYQIVRSFAGSKNKTKTVEVSRAVAPITLHNELALLPEHN